MKQCKTCLETKPLDAFHKNAQGKDGTYAHCKLCRCKRNNEYMKTYSKRKIHHSNYRFKLRKKVDLIKIDSGCTDCGVTYPEEPWLLEFDHLEEFSKEFNISQVINKSKGSSRLDDEIAKCEVVCLVCHRRRTAKRGQWTIDHLN